ncbi:MAG TPA: hypothetical protein VGD67_10050 [Pseudonocardiaceae bacterium]
MTAARPVRLGGAAVAAVLAGGALLLGAATPAAAQTAPRELTCTVNLGTLPAPVTVQPGERLQLVLVLPLLGTRVNVGPAQTAPTTPGEALIRDTVTGVVGLVGQVCGALVQVQGTVTSVVPVPPIAVPTLPPVLPSQTVQVPLPGADVGVTQPGTSGGTPPGTAPPGTAPPGTNPPGTTPPSAGPGSSGGTPGYRYENGGLSRFDLSRTPYGVASRFGPLAAPAFRFGQQVPGYSPQFGVLGDEDLADPGDVRALTVGGPAAVALPVLLAVLLLATVSGALVRTWALRRV